MRRGLPWSLQGGLPHTRSPVAALAMFHALQSRAIPVASIVAVPAGVAASVAAGEPDSDSYDEAEDAKIEFLVGVPGYPRASLIALPQMSVESEPRYVNAKQYERIRKRRKWRVDNAACLIREAEERERSTRQGYKYKSRHLLAKRRRRGKGGQFLSRKEIKALEDTGAGEGSAPRTGKATGDDHSAIERPPRGTGERNGSGEGDLARGDGSLGRPDEDMSSAHLLLRGWDSQEIEAFSQLFGDSCSGEGGLALPQME